MKLISNSVDLCSGLGHVILNPTNADDFYMLKSILDVGDQVEAHTTRKLSLDGGKTQQKISLRLAVKIESVEVDLTDGIMYVKGKVCKENEHVRLGVYHTLNIGINDQFSLSKVEWKGQHLKKIKDSAKDVPEMCFVVFYDRDCVVSAVSSNNIKTLLRQELKAKNYKNIISTLAGIKDKMRTFVLASVSDTRNDFQKALLKEHKDLEKKLLLVKLLPEQKNAPMSKIIGSVFSDPQLSKAFSNVNYVEDLLEIGLFFSSMDRGCYSDICIGMEEVGDAIECGAIGTLFVTDELYRPRTVEERRLIEEVVSRATSLKARLCVVPIVHDDGKRLKDIGGIAGRLKFAYK